MLQQKFSTDFEKILKPRIGEELGLACLGQRFNVDYCKRGLEGKLIELKLNRLYKKNSPDRFIANKKQYQIIKNRFLKNRQLYPLPNTEFAYFLVGYVSPVSTSDAMCANDVIKYMNVEEAFLIDYRNIPKYDTSGEDSRFFRLRIDTLNENTNKKIKVKLLGNELDLKILEQKEENISKLAESIFMSHR
jgi:hypothetical protein